MFTINMLLNNNTTIDPITQFGLVDFGQSIANLLVERLIVEQRMQCINDVINVLNFIIVQHSLVFSKIKCRSWRFWINTVVNVDNTTFYICRHSSNSGNCTTTVAAN